MGLGKMLRGAVEVTKAVGNLDLWIDALCIPQDNNKDKATIISQMGATNPNPNAFDVEDSVWRSRAWAFQERHLSRRVGYFTSSHMHFKCPHKSVSEDTVPGLSTDHRPTPVMDNSRFAQLSALTGYIGGDPTQTSFPNKTFHIHGLHPRAVTTMGLDPIAGANIPRLLGTQSQQRRHAPRRGGDLVEGLQRHRRHVHGTQDDMANGRAKSFQGVTHLLAQGIKTEFWHGLPEFTFDHSLPWYPREPQKRRTYEGACPSWSWAAGKDKRGTTAGDGETLLLYHPPT